MRLGVLVLAGCGRIGFDPTGGVGIDASSTDAPAMLYGFSTVSCPAAGGPGIVIYGDTACVPGRLRLTPDANGGFQGGIRLADPITFTSTTKMSMHIEIALLKLGGPGPPGDGMVVVFHADPRGGSYLGSGADLGYDGISPSAGIEIDTYNDNPPVDSNANHIGYDRDGDLDSVVDVMPGFALSNATFHLWIDYVGSGPALTVYADNVATKPPTPLFGETSEDLSRLGPAWLAIVAGTFFATETHDVLAWEIAITP